MSRSIEDLLAEFISLRPAETEDKLKCILTGHELPKTEKAIIQYTSGKKFKRLFTKIAVSNDQKTFAYEKYMEFLTLTPGKRLHCKLTNRIISNDPIDICRHIGGNNFLKCHENFLWKDCEN